MKSNETSVVTLRSLSRDTDKVVLSVALLYEFRNRVLVDGGSGDNRKFMQLSNIEIKKDLVDTLIGFHAFTGNDYISSFFRKGTEKCWKLVKKAKKFQKAFSILGGNWEGSNNPVIMLEEFVCQLYGYQNKSTDEVRFQIYDKKHTKEKKVIDKTALPLCSSVLRLHILRSNMVVSLWKHSTTASFTMPNVSKHGWELD